MYRAVKTFCDTFDFFHASFFRVKNALFHTKKPTWIAKKSVWMTVCKQITFQDIIFSFLFICGICEKYKYILWEIADVSGLIGGFFYSLQLNPWISLNSFSYTVFCFLFFLSFHANPSNLTEHLFNILWVQNTHALHQSILRFWCTVPYSM